MTSDKKSANYDTQSSTQNSNVAQYRVTSKGRSRNILRFHSEPPPILRETPQSVVSLHPDTSGQPDTLDHPDASIRKQEDEPQVQVSDSDASSIRIIGVNLPQHGQVQYEKPVWTQVEKTSTSLRSNDKNSQSKLPSRSESKKIKSNTPNRLVPIEVDDLSKSPQDNIKSKVKDRKRAEIKDKIPTNISSNNYGLTNGMQTSLIAKKDKASKTEKSESEKLKELLGSK